MVLTVLSDVLNILIEFDFECVSIFLQVKRFVFYELFKRCVASFFCEIAVGDAFWGIPFFVSDHKIESFEGIFFFLFLGSFEIFGGILLFCIFCFYFWLFWFKFCLFNEVDGADIEYLCYFISS